MDKTLKDYIERTTKRLEEENKSPEPQQYPVYPENNNEEDTPKNPYGQH